MKLKHNNNGSILTAELAEDKVIRNWAEQVLVVAGIGPIYAFDPESWTILEATPAERRQLKELGFESEPISR